jgi:hypothetical protein
MSINLLGLEEGFDVALASLNVIKGTLHQYLVPIAVRMLILRP